MKECSACGGQVRPSVVRCVHCGASLVEEAKAPAMVVGGRVVKTEPSALGQGPGRGAPSTTVARASIPPTTPSPASTPAPDPPATAPRADAVANVWAISTAQLGTAEESSRRTARPARRPRRVDLTLMLAGGGGLAAAIVAYTAIATPWVRAQITADERLSTRIAGRLLFRGTDAPGAAAVVVLTGVMAVLGVLWFWYGLDRGVHLPTFAHPAIGVVTGLAGLVVAVVARIGYLFWQGALIEDARQIGASRDAMRHLLGLHPPPSMAMHQLTGLLRFMVAMAIAIGAAGVAWWSQRSHA